MEKYNEIEIEKGYHTYTMFPFPYQATTDLTNTGMI